MVTLYNTVTLLGLYSIEVRNYGSSFLIIEFQNYFCLQQLQIILKLCNLLQFIFNTFIIKLHCFTRVYFVIFIKNTNAILLRTLNKIYFSFYLSHLSSDLLKPFDENLSKCSINVFKERKTD